MDDIYDMGKNKMSYNMAAASVGATSVCCISIDYIKLDIFRDFFQTIGLFFANISVKALEYSKYVFGYIGSFFALDFGFFIAISQIFFYAALFLVCFVIAALYLSSAYVSIKNTPDDTRDGHEGHGWETVRKKKCFSVAYMSIMIKVLIALYLPISRSLIQIIACDATMGTALHRINDDLCVKKDDYYDCKCSEWSLYPLFMILAFIFLLCITIGLPAFTAFVTYKNIPRGSIDHPGKVYDDFGQLVDYSSEQYKYDLINDPYQKKCPYRFLYFGYERKWAYFQTYTLVMKLVLILPIILFFRNVTYQVIFTTIITLFMVSVSLYAAPFINDQSDRMDISSKFSLFVTSFCSLLSCGDILPDASTGLAVLIYFVNTVSTILMLCLTLYGIGCVRKIIRNITSTFIFENSVTGESGGVKIIDDWDLEKEVKVRIWHRFWNSLTLNLCGSNVMKRMTELKDNVQRWGIFRVKYHVAGLADEEELNRRKWVMENLEGVDVYWTESTNNKVCKSKSHFGKLWINPYPFVCIVVYDDSDDYCYIEPEQFKEFVRINQDPEIVHKREIREILRSLKKEELFYDLDIQEKKEIKNAEYVGRCGIKRKDKSSKGTHLVDMHYTKAKITVIGNKDLPYSAGFKLKIELSGTGKYTRKGKELEIKDKKILKSGEFGISDTFEITPELEKVIYDERNAPIWQKTLQKYKEEVSKYRQKLQKERDEKESIISSNFWLTVYDNHTISYEDLVDYLTNVETNKTLQKIPRQHAKGLTSLYSRMELVSSHPAIALWYIFFDEVWESNNDIKIIQKNKKLLDPRQKDCICYTPLSREELTKKLNEKKLIKRWRLFNKSILDRLYKKIDKLNQEFGNPDDAANNSTNSVNKEGQGQSQGQEPTPQEPTYPAPAEVAKPNQVTPEVKQSV